MRIYERYPTVIVQILLGSWDATDKGIGIYSGGHDLGSGTTHEVGWVSSSRPRWSLLRAIGIEERLCDLRDVLCNELWIRS